MAKLETPFFDAPVAKFLRERIEALSPRKNQREIAAEVGYDKPNIVSMMKRGDAKVPLEKIPLFAKALEADAGHMFRLALEQYWPDLNEVVGEIFGNTVSSNEMMLVRKYRELTSDMDPQPTESQLNRLSEVINPKAAKANTEPVA